MYQYGSLNRGFLVLLLYCKQDDILLNSMGFGLYGRSKYLISGSSVDWTGAPYTVTDFTLSGSIGTLNLISYPNEKNSIVKKYVKIITSSTNSPHKLFTEGNKCAVYMPVDNPLLKSEFSIYQEGICSGKRYIVGILKKGFKLQGSELSTYNINWRVGDDVEY